MIGEFLLKELLGTDIKKHHCKINNERMNKINLIQLPTDYKKIRSLSVEKLITRQSWWNC